MSAILLVPPASEPLSLAEARQFLRVEYADDDAVITAARAHVEALTRRALLTQTWRIMLDAWPANGRVAPRIDPLQTLLAARVFDAAANVIAAPCWALPAPGRNFAGVELDVICGFGALASDVPADLIHALNILLAH
jgi:uncharacterized phiE125 gp8 family phage protein